MHVIRAPRVVADSVPLGPACVAVSDGVIVGVVAGDTYGGVRPDVDLPVRRAGPRAGRPADQRLLRGRLRRRRPGRLGRGRPRRLPETGVTSFLPTFITAPVPDLVAALRRTAALPARPRRRPGARRARRGPFLAARPARRARPGAAARPHPGGGRRADRGRPRAAADAHAGARAARCAGRDPPAGRRPACWSASGTATPPPTQAEAAADAGARLVTHLFNAHAPAAPPRARRGRAGAGRPAADLRADRRPAPRRRAGLPARVRGGAGPDRAGHRRGRGRRACRPGTYDLGGQQVSRRPRSACPAGADGTIAGSGAAAGRGHRQRGRRRRRPALGRRRGDPAAGRRDRPPRPRPDRGGRARPTWSGSATTCRPGDLAGREARVRHARLRCAGRTVDGAATASPAGDRVLP